MLVSSRPSAGALTGPGRARRRCRLGRRPGRRREVAPPSQQGGGVERCMRQRTQLGDRLARAHRSTPTDTALFVDAPYLYRLRGRTVDRQRQPPAEPTTTAPTTVAPRRCSDDGRSMHGTRTVATDPAPTTTPASPALMPDLVSHEPAGRSGRDSRSRRPSPSSARRRSPTEADPSSSADGASCTQLRHASQPVSRGPACGMTARPGDGHRLIAKLGSPPVVPTTDVRRYNT